MASSSIATPSTSHPVAASSATTTSAATAVMAQEMSAVQALKRLSIGASPTLDPDLPNYNDYTPTSPTSEQVFDFSSTSSLNVASQQLLWVPAHVHPEIAPQQWKNFVQDKLAEIQASGHSTSSSPSSPIKRRNSSLSRQIKDQEHYTDGADVLEKRKSIDNLQQNNHDPTILSLSQKLESLGELEGWSVDPLDLMRTLSISSTASTAAPLPNDSDSPILPSPTSSLRRSKHTRYNKTSIRKNRRGVLKSDSPENEMTPSVSSSITVDLQSISNNNPVLESGISISPPPPPPKDKSQKIKRVRIPITNKPLSECPEPVGNDYNNVPKLGSLRHIRPLMQRQQETHNVNNLKDGLISSNRQFDQINSHVEQVPVQDIEKPETRLHVNQVPDHVQRVPVPVPKDRQYERVPVQHEKQPKKTEQLGDQDQHDLQQRKERLHDKVNRVPVTDHLSLEQSDKVKINRVPINKSISENEEHQKSDPFHQKKHYNVKETAERPHVSELMSANDIFDQKPIDKSDRKLVTEKIERKPVTNMSEQKVPEKTVKKNLNSQPIVERKLVTDKIERKPVSAPAEGKAIQPTETNIISNDRDTDQKKFKNPQHLTIQDHEHASDELERKKVSEHIERKPVSKKFDQNQVQEAVKLAHEQEERTQPEERIERTPVADCQDDLRNHPGLTERKSIDITENTHIKPAETESKEFLGHNRSKNRKGTWGWLFNGVSSSQIGWSSPENKPKSSQPGQESFESMTADKASVDKFLNRTPSPKFDNSSILSTSTATHGNMIPDIVVTTSEEVIEPVDKHYHNNQSSNYNDKSGNTNNNGTSRKISGSASIAETKDRISNFFSKKKSMASIKHQKQQEKKRRTPSPGRSHSKSPVLNNKRYRSRSRHRSRSPEPEPEPEPEPAPKTEPEIHSLDQADFLSEAAISGIIPEGMEPTTNAAGLISYSAEAAAFYGAPYQIPAYQYSDKSLYMMNHRYEPHIERAIYRLSHLKLGNARRPLVQQVLLSNFMYAYLNLINQGFIRQQQEAQIEMQRQQQQQLQQQMQNHSEQYDNPDNTNHSGKSKYDQMYDYTTTTMADSSSSSSASSVAGDDMWQEDTFYDTQEVG